MSQDNQRTEETLQNLFLKACEQHHSGNLKEAKNGYLKILETADNPLLRYNLGLIYFEEEDFGRARDSFLAADRLQSDDIDTLFNLAVSYKQTGESASAITVYERILGLDPHYIDALYNLAGCHRELKHFERAVELYGDVLSLAPDHEAALNNIAYSYQVLGKKDKALHFYTLLLEHNPDHEAAKHMVASLRGVQVDHSPEGYIRDVFDNYSERYDECLVDRLEYSVPAKMRKLMNTIPALPEKFRNGIDLGCGTGLSGESFVDLVHSFHGVDLSSNMIEAARAKNIYSTLTTGSIQDALINSSTPFDLVLAADVLAYVGKLGDLFSAISDSSKPGAVICFSTESGGEEGFTLRATGRFAHNPNYVRSLAGNNGWTECCHERTGLRKEAGEWVTGDIWIFRTGS